MKKVIILLVLACSSVLAQYTDRNLNANLGSGALPATCTVGDIAFRTDVPAGTNMYGCTAANVWTNLGGAAAAAGAVGDVQYNDGAGGFAAESALNYTSGTNTLTLSSGMADLNYDSVGESSTNTLYLHNDTAATTGNNQWSPSIILEGQSYDNVGAPQSRWGKWTIENQAQESQNQLGGTQNWGLAGLTFTWQAEGGSAVKWLHMTHDPDTGSGVDSAISNLFVGFGAGGSSISGAAYGLIGIGDGALGSVTSGDEDVCVGYNCMDDVTTATWSTCVGIECLAQLQSNGYTVGLGQNAGGGGSDPSADVLGLRNSYVGVNAMPCTFNQNNDVVVLGEGACSDQEAVGVLGKSGMQWTVGGMSKSQHTFEVVDPDTLASETLSQTDFSTTTNWSAGNDFSFSGGQAVYVHSAGNGYLLQNEANFAINPAIGSRWYAFSYQVVSWSGDVSCGLGANFAATEEGAAVIVQLESVAYTATHTIYFKAIANPSQFSISCNSSSGGVVLDNVSVKEVTGGDLYSNRNVEADGSLIGGNDTLASAATLTLSDGNVFHITGTTNITTLNTCDADEAGRAVFLIFDDILTVTEGSNLVLAGDFTTGATDTISLVCDGTNWYEISRSDN